jgi:Acetyltransferase (isoleucine patch superfamily)
MTTMRERIDSGKLFTDNCEGLPEDRVNAKRKMIALNATGPDDLEARFKLIKEIFGGKARVWIEPPIYFCYGKNIEIGDGCYINFNCNFVDDGKIIIGDHVMFGPSVTIATVGHPINPGYRGYMYTDPVTIKDNCWIGAGTIICPGVTIGENSVIGAGSVVTKNIPSNSVAVGNPCNVLRTINEHDMKYYYKDREISQDDLDEEAKLR